MRRILLGIILPILLLAAVGGGIWLFLRDRNTAAPGSTAQNNGTSGGTHDNGGDEKAEPLRVGAQAGSIQSPTEAQRRASAEVDRDPFPSVYVEEGEPTYIETPGAFTEPSGPTPAAPAEQDVVTIPTQTAGTGGAPATPVLTGSLDEDRDGLTTDQELQQGTSPQRADTDNDGLTDGDEVRVYNTDPLNPDTDGDGYLDGAEVRAGYNPNGQGAL